MPTTAATEALSSVFGGDGSWVLVDVDATGAEDQLQVWFRIETSGGTPLLDYYNSSSSLGGTMNTGSSGAFLYSVPEPGTCLLGAVGLLGLLRRRHVPIIPGPPHVGPGA